MFFFFILGLLGGSPTPQDDLGQQALRDQWHESRLKSDSFEKFLKDHFLVGLAEESWTQVLKPQTHASDLSFSSDVDFSAYQARRMFAEEPLRMDRWVTGYVHSFRNILDRPYDSAYEVESWFQLLMMPLIFAVFWVLSFHLWLWSPAISQDFPSSFGTKSRFIVLTLLAASIFWAIETNQYGLFCELLLCLGVIYSRKPALFILGSFAGALLLTLQPFIMIGFTTLKDFSAKEALEKGRTRIEYSDTALRLLDPLEKSVWADLNGDSTQAQYWLDQAPPSKEKEILQANYQFSYSNPQPILDLYHHIEEKYGRDPLMTYNISQLYVRSQDLIGADKIRAELGTDLYSQLSTRASLMNRFLLNPWPDHRWDHYTQEFWNRASNYVSELGLRPFSLRWGPLHLLYLLIPWLLFFWALYQRPYSSGLCIQTGGVTSSPNSELSPLYLSYSQKSGFNHSVRQQVELLIRNHSQMQLYRTNLWSWVLPGAGFLIYEHSPWRCFQRTFFVFFLFWASFSWGMRDRMTQLMHFPGLMRWNQNTFSFLLLLISIIVFIFFIVESRRKIFR